MNAASLLVLRASLADLTKPDVNDFLDRGVESLVENGISIGWAIFQRAIIRGLPGFTHDEIRPLVNAAIKEQLDAPGFCGPYDSTLARGGVVDLLTDPLLMTMDAVVNDVILGAVDDPAGINSIVRVATTELGQEAGTLDVAALVALLLDDPSAVPGVLYDGTVLDGGVRVRVDDVALKNTDTFYDPPLPRMPVGLQIVARCD